MPFDSNAQQIDKMSKLPASETKRIFLLSNYSRHDRRKIRRMICSLGGEVTELTDKFNATHLVAPYFRLTSKMLAALAAGIWIVQTSYVLHSNEIGQWKLEETYEIGSKTCPYSVLHEHDSIPYMKELENAPRICRERSLFRKQRNFSDWKVVLVMEDLSKLLYIKRVLLAGGAFVLVLDLPIDADCVDVEHIDFAIVGVKDYSSLAPLKELNIRCVIYSYITDVLCLDPPPDIKLYDYHTRAENEKCFVRRDTNLELNTCQSSEVEEQTGTCFKTRTNDDEVENCTGKYNFQLSLGRSGSLLMNTAVSIIVDLNHEHNLKEDECSPGQNVYDIETVDLIGKSTDCSESFKMGLYQNLLNSPKKSFWNSSRLSKRDSASVYQKQSSTKHSPKKVYSPKSEMSRFKRRKLVSPQKNTILNYFINSEVPDCQEEENIRRRRRRSACGASSNSVSDKKCVNLGEYNSVKRTCRDYNSFADQSCRKSYESEVVVISSDESDDSEIEIVNNGNETAMNRVEICDKSIKSEVDTYNIKSELIEKTDFIEENSFMWKGNSLDMIRKEYDSDEGGEEYIVLSDEEEVPCLPLKHQIIDLTYDDECALDEAGAVIVPESKQSITSTLSDNDSVGSDEDDDCVNEIRFKSDKMSEKLRENCVDFNNRVIAAVLSPPVHIEMDNDSDSDVICEVLPMKHNSAEESILKDRPLDRQSSSPKFYSMCGHNENEIHTIIDEATLDLKENAENIEASLDNEDNVSSDSSLPSPPQFFLDDLIEVKRRQLSYESKSKTNISSKTKVKNELGVTGDNLKEILRNQIFSSNPDLRDFLSKCRKDISQSDKSTDMKTEIQDVQQSSKETGMESHCQTINPSAMRVCQVQAEVLSTKLNQPWLNLASHYISRCSVLGAAECANLHGKKGDFPEEADYDDENLVLRMDSGLDAVDLLQSRIDFATFPSPKTVQYVLLCCMDTWEEGVLDALDWLHQLLDEHPPCAFGMLDYYKRILFASVENMDASDGTFWWCITKIEEIMEAMEKEGPEICSTSKNEDSYQFIEEFLETCGTSSGKKAPKIKYLNKLEHLFGVLDFMISVMEADFNVGFLKHIGNLKQYTHKNGKPLIGVALWGTHGTVGIVNAKCRQMFKMYFKILKSVHDKKYPRNFKRLISLMAGVTYASERNSEPPKYPNVESNCKEFASSFASVIMRSELNLAEVPLILHTLRPDWFRTCVCSKLLEKLYGQNMDLSLEPTVHLLRKLCLLNYDFPSEEELSCTLLGDPDVKGVATEDPETLPQRLILAATKKDKKGETRLHIACRRNNVSEVEKLLNVPCINVNEKDNVGWTPLHEAALHGSVDCVRKLLNFRTQSGLPIADLRAKNNAGITPLMDAVLRNHLEISFELLQYGGEALLSDKDDTGRSPLDFAHTEEMKNILMNASKSTTNDLVAIPRSLFTKLVVLTPMAIGFYIKFSEVSKIVNYLKKNTELKGDSNALVKFQPVAFKKDYLEFRKLQILIREFQGMKIAQPLVLYS